MKINEIRGRGLPNFFENVTTDIVTTEKATKAEISYLKQSSREIMSLNPSAGY